MRVLLLLALQRLVLAAPCLRLQNVTSARRCLVAVAARERSAGVFVDGAACFACQPFSSASSGPCCAGFMFRAEPVPADRRLLLLLAKAGATSPFALFETSPSDAALQLATASAPYKSPIFDVAHQMGVRQVVVELLTASGEVAVRLRFLLQGELKSDPWFSKERLQEAYPWSTAAMQKSSYNYFSIAGFVDANSQRRFYISTFWEFCWTDKGYLTISDKESCGYFSGVTKPAFIWNPNPDDVWNARKYKQAAAFRLIGIVGVGVDWRVYRASMEP